MKKKENIIIIVLLIVMVLAVIGVSYAAFSYSRTGSKVNSITTGSITMTYTESDNTISLSGALPTTDKTGMVRLNEGEYFDFSVSSEIVGDVNINYEISAKDITTSDRKIDGSNIKLYLTRLTDDGKEEGLMTPETYNEESSSNSYTGRPSGEMSLYTSSMNSSESNNYRLRMYVDESYNPQGDGGGLTFSVRINVYGKAGDKYVPSAVETLLAKVNREDLDYNSATETQQKEMWTFTHPETEQTEALTDYRYIGSDPNNYVTFNNEIWRIIGVFSVDDGTGNVEERLKLIRNEPINTIVWDSNNTNDWTNATLNSYLNSGDYWTNNLSSDAKSMIDNAVWYLGGISNYASTTSDFYYYERGTTVYAGRDISWVGKIGLMYPSDYGYASSGDTANDRNSCLNMVLTRPGESGCYNNNWLTGYNMWTITSYIKFSSTIFNISNYFITNQESNYEGIHVEDANANKPVAFLKSNVKIVDGDGSSSNPYKLSE